ncbi:MAG: hypothetical protein HRU32_14385 [Rhodobacteraceae bacterium]|nr:hypothetical protein [Paracoccaceae bacterium]
MSKPPKPTDQDAEEDRVETSEVEAEAAETQETDDAVEFVGEDVTPDEIEDAEVISDPEPSGESSEELLEAETVALSDDEASDEAEPVADSEPAPRAEEPKSSTGWIGPFLGGAIAVAAGFVAAPYVLPSLDSSQSDETVELRAEIADLSARLEEATGRADATASELAGLVALDIENRLETLSTATPVEVVDNSPEVARLTEALEAALARIDVLETQDATASLDSTLTDEAMAAFESDVTAALSQAQAELETVRAAAAEVEQSAAEAAALAEAQAALQFVGVALVSGEPFADSLALVSETGADIPAELSDPSESGVPTLAALQESFPGAARVALDASRRAQTDDSLSARVVGFLQTQTGARSLAPREGDSADAVLSRAEAALRAGDVGTALTELEALPEAGSAEMQVWIAPAQERVAAVDALAALQAALSSQ